MRTRVTLITMLVVVVLAGVALVMTGVFGADHSTSDPTASDPTASGRTWKKGDPSSPCADGWDCAQLQRLVDAEAFLTSQAWLTGEPNVPSPGASPPVSRSGAPLPESQPSHLGIEVRDRRTGAVWRAGEPDFRIWAGSTPKLAFAVALREQARSGEITLDATAQRQLSQMLLVSDNDSAEALWNRYADSAALMTRFTTVYGMTSAGYVSGFPHRWGFVKCTSHDLASLMAYILDKLNAADRKYIVDLMRTVGPVQHWGVWAAGESLRPGVKNGWSVEKDAGKDHWITATVGFAGPDERYIVAAMYYQAPGGDSIDRGVHILTDLIATVFGTPVPAPATIPPDY